MLVFLCWLIHALDKTPGSLSCIFYFILEWIMVKPPEELSRRKQITGRIHLGPIDWNLVQSIGGLKSLSYLGYPIDRMDNAIDRMAKEFRESL